MPQAWRIVSARFQAQAFDGEGARLHGGRWNNPGARVVYCAGSVSLATLEMLVHLPGSALLPSYRWRDRGNVLARAVEHIRGAQPLLSPTG